MSGSKTRRRTATGSCRDISSYDMAAYTSQWTSLAPLLNLVCLFLRNQGSTGTRALAKLQSIATRRNPTTYPFEVQGPAAQQFPCIDLISRETVSQNEREINAIQESRSLMNDLRRRSISEWTQEPIGRDREDDQSGRNSRARPARCSADDGS